MGLDMYLQKKTYVRDWSFGKDEDMVEVYVLKGRKPHPLIRPERLSYVEEEVGYWRKANAIHAFFVDTLAEGVDDCRPIYVPKGAMEDLLKRCQIILNSGPAFKETAEALLPTRSGFFFGDTEYGESYREDLEMTVKIISEVLAEDPNGHYEYRASW